MLTYTGVKGSTYTIGNKIGSGGEGVVFEVQGRNDIVAKLYKSEKIKNSDDRETKERKLRAMLNMNIPERVQGLLRLAWPLDILYEQGKMVGFIMPKISNMLKIYDIQRCWRPDADNPSTKATLAAYPDFTWKYAVQFAYNLAWIIKYVHSYGIVIGDLNQNNIYADTNTGAVVLIDCDSFDITDKDTGERFPCEVGFQEMLAPELQVSGTLKGKFTKDTDNFSLAIHIFRLLMRNADPFNGVPSQGASSSAITKGNVNIINGNCPYVRNCAVTIPAWAPDLSILPFNLQNLFKKTFDYTAITVQTKKNKRATAEEWCNALLPLAEREPNANLTRCKNTNHAYYQYHVYAAHNKICPWCQCEDNENYKMMSSPSLASKPQPVQIQQAASQGLQPRRTPYLFYAVLMILGIISGFVFEDIVSDALEEMFELYLSPTTCAIVLSLFGLIGGGWIAHIFEDKYIYANNAIPWLLLGGIVLFVPPIVVTLLGISAVLIMLIIEAILVILGIVVGVFCLCSCCSGS